MPRRSRPIEYDDVIDNTEEVYPSRAKGDPLLVDRDARYSRRVPRGHGPVVENLDRRHVRERAKPEIPLEGYEYLRDDVLTAERLARLDLNAYRNEEVDKYKDIAYNARGSKPRGRRRSRVSDVEEAYFSHGDSTQDYTDSESDVVEEIVSKKKRPVMPRHDHHARKEAIAPSKSVKDERHMRRSKYDDGAFPKNSRSMEAFPGDKRGPRRDAAPRSHQRSHYHIDIVDDESDETDESELDVLPKHGRRQGVARGDPIRQKYSTRRRATPSSLSSSSESAGSSEEEELPKVPLPVPVPPIYKDSPRRHKSLNHSLALQIPRPPSPPTPPRVPDLETVLNEREARHRKRAEDAAKEEVEIEKRSRESLQLPPQEHNTRRKKGKPAAIVEPPEFESKDVRVEDGRVDPRRSYKKRDIVEEDHYRGRDPQPRRSSPLSDPMDDWAIVQAPSKLKHNPEKELPVVDVREESRRSRRKDRQANPAEDDMRELRHKGDTPRSKVGPRYIGVKDRRERLWTEITKDLVVKEAIERAGYEYEEMDTVYYIFSYLHPEDVNALVEDSDDIRRARRRRIQQIQRERASVPPSSRRSPNKSAPILPERPPSPPVPPSPPPPPRQYRDDRRDDRRRRERPREYEREEDIEEGRWRSRPSRW